MAEESLHLDRETKAKLEAYAALRGISVTEAVEELTSGELRRRTQPRPCKGTVQPFRRR
jgi:hypothetical protein